METEIKAKEDTPAAKMDGGGLKGGIMPYPKPNYQEVEVRLNDKTELIGDMNLGESYKRVAELMDSPSRFIVLSNIESSGFGENGTIVLNKNSIAWVEPI